jgi:hypothetical protein
MMYGISAIRPMGAAEMRGVEQFHQRLETPIGGLPEDHPPEAVRPARVSPFRVVGVCVASIGALMLCVQPFIADVLPKLLNLVLGLALATIGVLMGWLSRPRKPKPAHE